MKKIIIDWRKLALWVCILFTALLPAKVFGQSPPTFTTSSTFGLLAADSIITTDSIKVYGDAGAATFIQSKVTADSKYFSGTTLTNALSDLASVKTYLSGQSGTTISGTLDGQTLSAGVYNISGNASLGDTLILNGDTDAVFIFNISGNLNINTGAWLETAIIYGVNPENIFWNISGKTIINGGGFAGIVLGSADIEIQSTFLGRVCLLSQSAIRFSDPQQLNFTGVEFGYSIYSFAKMSRGYDELCVAPSPTCNEFIANGSFEIMNPDYSPACPSGITIASEVMTSGLIACEWQCMPIWGMTTTTPDIFNTCATGSVDVPVNDFGTQAPHSGNGYMGMIAGLTAPSTPPTEGAINEFLPPGSGLTAGKVYFYEMWVSLAEMSNRATTLGVLFTDGTGFSTYDYSHPSVISDKTAWTPIRTCFTATGTERAIWIRNYTYPGAPVATVASTPGYTYSSPANPTAYYYLDDVSLRPLADAGLDQSVCGTAVVGGCLTPITGATYSWSTVSGPGAASFSSSSVANPTVTMTTAGVYTFSVTVTYGGCSATDQVVITKLPVPTGLTATATPSSIPLGASSSLSASATGTGITYSWSPGGMSGTPVTVYPTATTVYTVTATNSSGCTANTNVTVTVSNPPCELSTFDYTVPSGGGISSAIFGPGSVTISNKNIKLDGDLTISNQITFNNCNILVAAGKKIVLNGTIYNPTLNLVNYTHVYSCTDMWDGIYVIATNAYLNINTNAFVEDAVNAVVSQSGGVFTIHTAIFNRNLKAVDVQTYASAHTGTVKNTVFTSRYIPANAIPTTNYSVATLKPLLNALSSANMKAPYNTQKAVTGVKVNTVSSIQVGIATSGLTNVFDNLNCGIEVNNSNITIHNNQFKNLLVPSLCAMCYAFNGYGIYATGTATGNYSINVGGFNPNEPNDFYNIHRPVRIVNYKTNNVLVNTIDNSTTASGATIGYGDQGVYITPAKNNTVNVLENSINNCKYGLWLNRNNVNANDVVNMSVNDNTISSSGTGYCTYGIYVSDFGTVPAIAPTTSEMLNNTVNLAAHCITVLSSKRPMYMQYNSVTTKYAASGNINGIRVQGSEGLMVTNNRTKYDVTTAGLSGGNLLAYGMYINASKNMIVKCNTMQDAGRALVFYGNCSSPTSGGFGITQNTMRRAQDGFVLLNSGIIGQQGATPSTPSNNYWDMSTTPNFTRSQTYTDGTNNANTLSKLYMNNISSGATATLPTDNESNLGVAFAYTLGTGLNTVTGSLAACGFVPALAPIGETKDETVEAEYVNYLEDITENAPSTETGINELDWQLEKYVFEQVHTNALLGLDSTLTAFYDNQYNQPLGQLTRFDDYLNAGDYAGAESLNQSVAVSNLPEQNQQAVNILCLKKTMDSLYVYDSLDMANIESIANQCPLLGGTAVFQARVLLMGINETLIEFNDDCEVQKSLKQPSNEISNSSFTVYPNPNNGNMILNYSLNEGEKGEMRLYNYTGQQVGVYTLNPSGKQISIGGNHLANGVYTYRISVNGKLAATNKVVVVK